VLLEQHRQTANWNEIQVDQGSSPTYSDAMAAGLVALQAMVDDLAAGPRGEAAEKPEPEPEPERPGSHFGFGDLRA
jgi:hypothetical protein